MSATRELILYGRPDCHLCDEARELIHSLGIPAEIEFREVDIDRDERLLRKYLERIPVVALDGAVVSELVPDRDSICAVLLHTPSQ